MEDLVFAQPDSDMVNPVARPSTAPVTVLSPKYQVSRLCVLASKLLSSLAVVLELGGAADDLFVPGSLANGVLGEA